MLTDWTPPRCGHGNILLGCPHDDCPEQNVYVTEQHAAIDAYQQMQEDTARDYVWGAIRDEAGRRGLPWPPR